MNGLLKKITYQVILVILLLSIITIVSASVTTTTNNNDNFIYSSSSSDSSYVIKAMSDNNILFFDNIEGTVPWTYNVGQKIGAVAISSDGNYVVVSCDGGMIFLFNKKGDILWKKAMGNVFIKSLSISKDNKFIDLSSVSNQVFYVTIDGRQIEGAIRWAGGPNPVPTTILTVIPTSIPTPIITSIPTGIPTITPTVNNQIQNNYPFNFNNYPFIWIIFGIIGIFVIWVITKSNQKTITSRTPLKPVTEKKPQNKTDQPAKTVTVRSDLPLKKEPTIPLKSTSEKPQPDFAPLSKPKTEDTSDILIRPHRHPVLVIKPTPSRIGEILPQHNNPVSQVPIDEIGIIKNIPNIKPAETIGEDIFEPQQDDKLIINLSNRPHIASSLKSTQIEEKEILISESPLIQSERVPLPEKIVDIEVSPVLEEPNTVREILNQAKQYLDEGNNFFELGRYVEALSSYEKAIAINPDHNEAWSNRGNALGKLGQHAEALVSYDKAIALNPKDADKAWYNRGVTLGKLGQYPQALSSYDKAIAINPEYALARTKRGDVIRKIGQHTQPDTPSDKAITVKPDFHTVKDVQKKSINKSENVRPVSGIKNEEGLLHLDPNKLEKIKKDTQKVQAILGNLLDTEEDTESTYQIDPISPISGNEPVEKKSQVIYNLPFSSEILVCLEPKYIPLLEKIVGRTDISKDELKKIVRESHLMYEATITDINTWAEENLEDFLFEVDPEENSIKINNRWKQ